MELTRENSVLRAELYSIKEKFGLPQTQVSTSEHTSVQLTKIQDKNKNFGHIYNN